MMHASIRLFPIHVKLKAGTHMRTKQLANSSHWLCGKLIFCEPEANAGHTVHPIPFVFAQKTNKFRFVANGMQTIHRQHSTCLQSYTHICAFGLRIIWFACVYTSLNTSLHGESFPICCLYHVIHAVRRRMQYAAYVMNHKERRCSCSVLRIKQPSTES